MLDKVKLLLSYYEQGFIPTLSSHEVNPGLPLGSRENYLYFTLPVCINFQRSSPQMWAAALMTYEDIDTRYLFFPESIANKPLEQVRADLTKYNLALQPNKHVRIWTTIAKTIHDHYHDDPREIINEAERDAEKLIYLLQVAHKTWFPYLSGPKLSNYWPFILELFTDANLTNPQEISIIPDTHVLQSSKALGLTPAGSTPLQVEAAWRDLLKDSGITPAQMHPVLWNWSRNNFMPKL